MNYVCQHQLQITYYFEFDFNSNFIFSILNTMQITNISVIKKHNNLFTWSNK